MQRSFRNRARQWKINLTGVRRNRKTASIDCFGARGLQYDGRVSRQGHRRGGAPAQGGPQGGGTKRAKRMAKPRRAARRYLPFSPREGF